MDMVPEMEIGGAGALVAGNLNGFHKLPLQNGKGICQKKKKKKKADIHLPPTLGFDNLG